MVSKGYGVEIRDDDGNIIESTTFWEEDVERCGGIGAIVETLSMFRANRESIEVHVFYTDT